MIIFCHKLHNGGENMSCPYQEYHNDETYYPHLWCSIDNSMCYYQKKCLDVERYISIDDAKECFKLVEEQRKNIPNGAYYVQDRRTDRHGNLILYVVINDLVTKIVTKLDNFEQNYIYLKESTDGYKVSLTPFVSKRKNKSKK